MVALTTPESETALQQPRSRILVVDDNPSNREYLELALSRRYDVTGAEDGPQALQILQEQAFDLVILDIMMPKMSGLETLRHIRAQSASLPVILLSALSSPQDIVSGLRMGANDYIVKAETHDVIMARIETQIQNKRLMDERQDLLDQLQQLDHLRTQLLHIASHDLKNLLNNIVLAEYEIRNRHDNLLTQNNLDTIHASSQAMHSIIRDFLEMLHIRTGKLDVKREPVYLMEAVYSVVAQYEIALQRKSLDLHIMDVDGWVWADSDRMTQILGNLLNNAIKYSQPHSTIQVSSVRYGDFYRVCIADGGPGIAPSERERLFQLFGRTSNQPTGGEQSHGIGLWIVKHLTELQGGQVGVEFPERGGSVFWAQFPCYDV